MPRAVQWGLCPEQDECAMPEPLCLLPESLALANSALTIGCQIIKRDLQINVQ